VERVWEVSYAAAWLLLVLELLTLLAVLCVVGRVHLKRSADAHALITDEGPGIHSVMPEFEGVDTGGRLIHSGDFRGRDVVLLLMSPHCIPCERVLGALRPVQRRLRICPEFLVVLEATRPEIDALARCYHFKTSPIVDEQAEVRSRLGIDRTPYGFLIDSEGIVRMKGVISDGGQLEGLIGRRGRHIRGMAWQTLGEASG
jgi:methylamine dehydrogenase accessory protein MauD